MKLERVRALASVRLVWCTVLLYDNLTGLHTAVCVATVLSACLSLSVRSIRLCHQPHSIASDHKYRPQSTIYSGLLGAV